MNALQFVTCITNEYIVAVSSGISYCSIHKIKLQKYFISLIRASGMKAELNELLIEQLTLL